MPRLNEKTTEERLAELEERVRLLLAVSLYDTAAVSHGELDRLDDATRARLNERGKMVAATVRKEIAQ